MGLCLKIRPKIAQGWMKKKDIVRQTLF